MISTSARLDRLAVLVVALVASCGGDDGGVLPSDGAGAQTVGLGATCDPTSDDAEGCNADAPACLSSPGDTVGICSRLCITDGTGTTDAAGNLPFATIQPPPDMDGCEAAFSADVGTARCELLTATTPMHNPLMPSTSYTGITVYCAVKCDSGACPTGLTCQQNFCLP